MSGPGIYEIRSPSGSIYIGSSKHPRNRFTQHLRRLRAGTHDNRMLQRAYCKYGESAMVFSVILHCDQEFLLIEEQRLIDEMRPKYNICRVAGTVEGIKWTDKQRVALKGRKVDGSLISKGMMASTTREQRVAQAVAARAAWTDEIRRSARDKAIGRKRSPESIAKTAAALVGRPVSEETRAKIAAQAGWKHSAEASEKMSKAKTGKTGALCPNSKPLRCSNGMLFHGTYAAQQWLRLNDHPKAHAARVGAVCRGERNKAYGLQWSYEVNE